MKKMIVEYENSYIEYKFKDSVKHMMYVADALKNPFGGPKKITLQKYPLKNNEIEILYDREWEK